MRSFNYRPDVDGLRALAGLGVILCHAEFGVPGGFVGVDVFFVISGYLIASLIIKDLRQGTFSLANFWERRIRRIVPALLTVTLVTTLASWFLLVPEALAAFGKSVVALGCLVSNVHFWREVGYFAAAADEKPLLHTWSLAVEEQFYLFVPVFLLLMSRVCRLHWAVTLVAIAAVVSFGVSVYGVAHHPSATFYLLPTRAWELFAGVLLAFRLADRSGRPGRWREPVAALGLALILAACFLYDDKTPFPGLAAVPPVLGTALLIVSGHAKDGLPYTNRFLACGPLVFIGLISYSLYLWHWPLFAIARHQSIYPLGVVDKLLLIAASFVLAVISWRFVETPIRSRRFLATRAKLFATVPLAYSALLLAGIALHQGEGFPWRLPMQAQLYAGTGRLDPRFIIELGSSDVPERLPRLGNPDTPAEVLIWGDSHAMAIVPAIESLCQEEGLTARVATHSSTAPVIEYFFRNRYGLNSEAMSFTAAIAAYVRSSKVRIVVLAANWNMYCWDPSFLPALLKTLDTLRDAGATVCFMNTVPIFAFDVPKALVLYTWRGWDLSRLGLPEVNYRAGSSFQNTLLCSLRERQVVILDPVPILQERTNSTDILPFDAGGSFYRDCGHLSTYGALAMKPLFAPVFRSVQRQRNSEVAGQNVSVGTGRGPVN